MPLKNWQKIKLMKLSEMLIRESDEDHPLTTTDICEKMEELDIPCDRRVVSEDIKILQDQGMEILDTRVGKKKAYYVEDRSFSVPELKILIDAVQAATFITEKKTAELIDKIADLAGDNRADVLKGNLVSFNTRKHRNEYIYYNVDALETALQKKKKVIFRYFDLDVNGKRVYRRDGHHYVVEPVALVFNEDNYYAVVYSSRYDDTANYRIDRMEGVEVKLDEPISEKALELRKSVSKYTEQAFKMYGGPSESVTLEYDQTLIGAVYDRFGENIKMKEAGDNKVTATVRVQLSPTFWGWLFQFGRQIRILSPESVNMEYRDRVRQILE